MHGVGRNRIYRYILAFWRTLSGPALRPSHSSNHQESSVGRIIAAALGYIDDFWVSAETEEECLCAYNRLIELLLDLGFVVNRNKCVPPTTRLTFLGIELDSDAQSEGICRMTIPTAKRERGAKLCADFLARVPATGGYIRGSPYLATE